MVFQTVIERSFTVKGVPSAIADIYDDLLTAMKVMKYDGTDVFSVHLAMEEAFANAMKHGNKMDPEKTIEIEYRINHRKLEITLTDMGEGFDPNSVPDPRLGNNVYKAYGRGILLMRSYMDKVEYNRKGNSVHMIKYRQKQKRKKPEP